MYRITFALGDTTGAPHGVTPTYVPGMMRGPSAEHQIGPVLASLVRADELYLRAHPSLPSVLQAGVRWDRDPQGVSDEKEDCWQDVPTCLALRKGSDVDLACWRAAELNVQGVPAAPLVSASRDAQGHLAYRALVQTPAGVEDPAGRLGAPPMNQRPTHAVSRVARVAVFLNLFNGPQERLLSNETLQVLLDALCRLDEERLRADPTIPLLYRSGVVYQEEPKGQEDWQDLPWTLKLGYGDCLPLGTKTLRRDDKKTERVSIARLEPGDEIMGDGTWTTVTSVALTGNKPILRFVLSNGEALRCSPQHRLFLSDGEERRAERVLAGEELKSPSRVSVRVLAVREEPPEACCDLTTDDGRFYLPDPDVVVHNCEDLACWRAAELRARFGIDARPTFTSQVKPDGTYLYHILVALPDGRIEDPSRNLGMR